LAHKSDKSTHQSTYQNSFEFLDMSACDESQKLKLKSTLEMPAVTSAPRDRYRSNFMTRNVSIKPQHYHLNNYVKTQRNYQSHPSKFPNTLEHHETRSYTSEGNNFSNNKINSNFNNQISTNINDRHFSNTQDKVNKWNNKKQNGKISLL
jgi:hypothetical protein